MAPERYLLTYLKQNYKPLYWLQCNIRKPFKSFTLIIFCHFIFWTFLCSRNCRINTSLVPPLSPQLPCFLLIQLLSGLCCFELSLFPIGQQWLKSPDCLSRSSVIARSAPSSGSCWARPRTCSSSGPQQWRIVWALSSFLLLEWVCMCNPIWPCVYSPRPSLEISMCS